MTLLYRAATAMNLTLADSDSSAHSGFSDCAAVDSWAIEAMAALVTAGILSRVLQSSMPTPPDGAAPTGAPDGSTDETASDSSQT